MDIENLSVSELRARIRDHSLSISEIARQTSKAVERHRDINAIISSKPELLMKHAKTLEAEIDTGDKRPLLGIPVLVKDNIDTVDFPTTGGTTALAGHQPRVDAGVVRCLKEAGALLVGKANLHELAFGITSNNACTGAVHNPWDHRLIPGGSSGGSAAAVAAGIVPLALGSDTGGSNRIPAALCGVCGFRPGIGRYPGDGLINLSLTRDTVGIFARNVADIATVDAVFTEPWQLAEIDVRSLRLALPRDPFYKALEKETAQVIKDALARIAAGGAQLVEIDMDELFALNDRVSFPIALYETLRELTDYLQRNRLGISLQDLTAGIASPDVKHIMEAAQNEQKVSEAVYREALNVHRPRLQQMYADFFAANNIDAMLYPTTPLTARPIGDDETVELNGRRLPTFPSFVRNGDPSSNAGIPSLVVPAGLTTGGLPVGLSIDGPLNSDHRLLAIGKAVSCLLPVIKGPPATPR